MGLIDDARVTGLRWLERDGAKVLQIAAACHLIDPIGTVLAEWTEWEDVPTFSAQDAPVAQDEASAAPDWAEAPPGAPGAQARPCDDPGWLA
jgi:hypothetical protein